MQMLGSDEHFPKASASITDSFDSDSNMIVASFLHSKKICPGNIGTCDGMQTEQSPKHRQKAPGSIHASLD
jgi:hypothetical protein